MDTSRPFDLTEAEWITVTPEMFDALMYNYMRKIAQKRPTPSRMAFMERCYLLNKLGNPKNASILEYDSDTPTNKTA